MDDDRGVRLLRTDEYREAGDVFRGAMHLPPNDDAYWAARPIDDHHGRAYGSFEGGELVGTTWSFASRTTVPGGSALPTAAVTQVGVRADRTRRGHVTDLLRTQLTDAAGQGVVLATLHPSESAIYGRFGFGAGTRSETVAIGPTARVRAAAPGPGAVRILNRDRAQAVVSSLYERIALDRPGAMTRTDAWWTRARIRPVLQGFTLESAVHTGPDGDDGYVVWTGERTGEDVTARVLDLRAANPAAATGLWRFLLGIDLVTRVESRGRPRDEQLDLLVEDPRDVRILGRDDELWVRLLDVQAALAARTWGDAEPVVLRVHDTLFAANDATYRLGTDGPTVLDADPPADQPVDLECDVDALAMAYLGDRRPSELVASGWWRAHDETAPARADALFATGAVPWCGTFF